MTKWETATAEEILADLRKWKHAFEQDYQRQSAQYWEPCVVTAEDPESEVWD